MKYKFLINTLTDWDEPPRARHQVADALSKQFEVVFVSANRLGLPRMKVMQAKTNLVVLIPYFPIDYRIRYRIPFLNTIYQLWLYRILKKKYADYYVINFDFTAVLLSRYFKEIVYYCNDDYVSISKLNNAPQIVRYHKRCEKTVTTNAKFCIGTSDFLVKKLKESNQKAFEIRLGAPQIDSMPVHSVKTKRKPESLINVGFVGYISTIEKELLDFLITREKLGFTLVGPMSNKEHSQFNNLSNIRATGKLTGQELYDEVVSFDVGIIPYNLKSTIDRTPNKLWLYLSLGKPVVISNIPSIQGWQFPDHFIYRSDDYHDFYTNIIKAFEADNDILIKSRIAYANRNTWESRMDDFIKILNRVEQYNNII